MTAATDCKGERAARFINNLQHTKGKHAGQGFNLRGWQQDIIRPLFGTLMEDGRRVYRTCFTFLPRKNGKSELAAAIALYMLLGDGEMGGEIYSAAACSLCILFLSAGDKPNLAPKDAICLAHSSRLAISGLALSPPSPVVATSPISNTTPHSRTHSAQ